MTERWLIYGHDLSREFSPIELWLAVLSVSLILFVLTYIVREFRIGLRWVRVLRTPIKFPWICRRIPSTGIDAILHELKVVMEQLQVLPIIKDEVALARADQAQMQTALSHQAGRLDGAVDTMKTIVHDATIRERKAIAEIRQERQKIKHVHDSITEFMSRLPHDGSA